jgi:hypothetical protein
MNPYGGASVSIGYFIDGEGKGAPTVGQISMRASARDYKPIPGGPVEMKLVIDDKVFGPLPLQPSADSDGMYSVWLDTAETDGDSKPPILKPADFASLAMAGRCIQGPPKSSSLRAARGHREDAVNITKRVEWRDGLAPWAKETKPRMSATGTDCAGGDKIVN